MNKFIELTDDVWERQFKPMNNQIVPANELQYETYGEEVSHVHMMNLKRQVWTCIEGDGGQLTIVSGMAYVNRLYYYVCEVPYEPDTDYEVVDPWEE